MFSSLASYLLGNQSLSPEAETAEVRLRAVDSDDDWVLVEKTGTSGTGIMKQLTLQDDVTVIAFKMSYRCTFTENFYLVLEIAHQNFINFFFYLSCVCFHH